MAEEKASEVSRSELFVRSIPLDATSEELSEFFSQVSPVKHAVVVTNSGTGESKGFGFVSFVEADDAKAALEKCRKIEFKGKLLQLEFAKPRARKASRDKPKTDEEPIEKRKPRLIIRNLPWSVRDKNVLVDIFKKYGKVLDAVIPRGKGGKMSGFAFVTMRKKSHALKAIEGSKDLKIAGREVAVDFAVEKSKWLGGVKDEVYDDEDSEESEDDNSERGDDKTSVLRSKGDEFKATNGQEDDMDIENDEDEDEGDEGDVEGDDEGDDEGDEGEDEGDYDQPQRKKVRGAPNSNTVFVRNIPYDSTAETLAEHFSQFGAVRYALPVMDKELNQPKGTAFVAFYKEEDCAECVSNAPTSGTTSLLIPDNIDPKYVSEGRVLSVTKAVDRGRAEQLSTASAAERLKVLGKVPEARDKRNTFLLNEGRITSDSKIGQTIPASELEIRQKSYDLRKQQLAKNPSLRLSLTRLAIRNLPRSVNDRALKQIARKAVVEFAKEVKEGLRQPLTKEEITRSIKATEGENARSKRGVVRQAKIINEQKGSGIEGRSRGYGFVEYRNHRAALMGLRWLNANLVTKEDVLLGYPEDKWESVNLKDTRRRLVVEFAIENAQVVKRRRESQMRSKLASDKRKAAYEKELAAEAQLAKEKETENAVNHIIGKKRKFRKMRAKSLTNRR